MELVQLRYFVTIAETLSFTRAAELVHVSQPALSYQMKRLEEELAAKLFDKRGRGIGLTANGQLFLPMVQGVLARLDEAVRTVRNQSGGETGEVTMGVPPSVAAYLAPNTLASFHQVFPRVRVGLVEDGDQQLLLGVSTGSLDFAIVAESGSLQSLDITPLGAEDLFAITSLAHKASAQMVVDLAELRNEDFVLLGPQHRLTTLTLHLCRRAGFEPIVAYHSASLHTLKNLVRAGLGVSVLPASALVGGARGNLSVLRIKGGPTRELFLAKAKDRDPSSAAQVLLTHMRTEVSRNMTYPPKTERSRLSDPQRPAQDLTQ